VPPRRQDRDHAADGAGVHFAAGRHPQCRGRHRTRPLDRVDTRVKPSDESLQALTARILKAERPVIIVGDEIVKKRCVAGGRSTGGNAGLPGLPVVDGRMARNSCRKAPASWARWRASRKSHADTLQPYDLIIALGGDPLRMSVYSEIDPLPDGLSIVQVGLVDHDSPGITVSR